MAINSGGVRSAAVYSTGVIVVGVTVSIVWAVGALVLWLKPIMAAALTGHAAADPQSFLVRLTVGLSVIMVALLVPALAKVVWFFLGELGECALRKLDLTRHRLTGEQ